MPTFNKDKTSKLKVIDKLFKSLYIRPKNKAVYKPLMEEKNNEILILGFLLIGDTIMYIPAFKSIRKNFPDARITLVCEMQTKLILSEQNLIDNFVIINCPWIVKTDYSLKNLFSFKSALKQINRVVYDLAIDFRGDWRNIFYLNFIKAKRKASFNFTGGDYMLTDVITPDPLIDNFTEEALYLLKKIGLSIDKHDLIPQLTVSELCKPFLESYKQKHNLNGKYIVGIHPGSSQEVKKWDEEKYTELVSVLNSDLDAVFLIFEGPNENETVFKITEKLIERNIPYLVVKEKLLDYINIISLCDLVICNDSGAGHIAGAFGVKTVIIFGNVDPKYIVSKYASHVVAISHTLECKPCFQSFCKYEHKECIKGISVEEVYKSASFLINNK